MLVRHRLSGLSSVCAVCLLTAVGAPNALAYQFGPPPITELAEAGGTQGRVSVYSQKNTVNSTTSSPTFEADLKGLGLTVSHGDRSGAVAFMLRGAQYSDNRVASGASGALFGTGVGGQWYFGQERAFGLLLNGQMDLLAFNYAVGTASHNVSQLAFGVEVGAMYRIFIDTATITPFVTVGRGVRSRTDLCSVTTCSDVDYKYKDSATTFGIDLMVGPFSAAILKTDSAYDTSYSFYNPTPSGATGTLPTTKMSTTMLMIGFNF